MAIENEDYDSAKVLKYEIDRLRSLAMNLDTDRATLTPIRQNRVAYNMDSNNDNYEDMRSIKGMTRGGDDDNGSMGMMPVDQN
jgi:hypothetical protein